MKEYAEDDTDIGTEVAALDDGFEKDLGSRRRTSAARKPKSSNSVMDSFFGPLPVHGEPYSVMCFVYKLVYNLIIALRLVTL